MTVAGGGRRAETQLGETDADDTWSVVRSGRKTPGRVALSPFA